MTTDRATQLARNADRQCDVAGCYRRRHAVSRYCNYHAKKSLRYGNPKGSPLLAKELAYYERQVSDYLKPHHDHPAVVAAVQWLATYIRRGPYRSDHEEHAVVNVRSHGMNPLHILIRLASVWLLSIDQPQRLPDDRDALTFALGVRLAHCCPYPQYRGANGSVRYRRPGAHAHKAIGFAIRAAFGVFFNNVARVLAERDAKLAAQARAIRSPLPEAPTPPAKPPRTVQTIPSEGSSPTTPPDPPSRGVWTHH